MKRIGAVASRIRAKQRGARKRSDSEEEALQLSRKSHTEIEDIDIRENTNRRLRFRKMPWTEMLLGGGFLITVGIMVVIDYFNPGGFKKGQRLLIGILCAVLLFVACTALWECYIESIVFDKKRDIIQLDRTHMLTMSSKTTWHRMSQVARVYAALRGNKKGNNDMTFYVLIIKLFNG